MSGVRVPLRPLLEPDFGQQQGPSLKRSELAPDIGEVPTPWTTPEQRRLAELRPNPTTRNPNPEVVKVPAPPDLNVPTMEAVVGHLQIAELDRRLRMPLKDARALLGWQPGDRLIVSRSNGVVKLEKGTPSERRFAGSAVILPDGRFPIGRASGDILGVREGGRVLVDTDTEGACVFLRSISGLHFQRPGEDD